MLFVRTLSATSQNLASFSVDIVWNGVEDFVFENDTVRRVSFENASFNNVFVDKNPVYRHNIPLFTDNVDAEFSVKVKDASTLSEDELALLDDTDFGNVPSFRYYVQTSRDNNSLCFELIPFFKDEDGDIKRVLSCDVDYSISYLDRETRNSLYAENSVLAAGTWYKMSLTSTGMYKISYSDMESMGIPVESINPKNIRLFHNGGGVLPVINREKRNDDLVEIPIYVHGENDGVFNQNDYLIFYARGPVVWRNVNGVFEKISNPYSDHSYVFMTTNLGEGKRIEKSEILDGEYDEVVDSFVDYQIVEKDEFNLNNMGATWYFDKFDVTLTRTYSFNFPNLIKEKKCKLYAEVASRNFSNAAFTFKSAGKTIAQLSFSKNASDDVYANVSTTGNVGFTSSKDEINVDLTYSRSTSSSAGWLDYISINAWRKLSYVGNMMSFRNPDCSDNAKVYRYEIGNVNKQMQVWDVSDPTGPKKVDLQYSSNKAYFLAKGFAQNEFIAFDGSGYKSVTYAGTVKNQNLHSKYDFDYLIITHPDFYSQSQRLKAIHSQIDDLEIEIVTPQQIYNEFSCGAQDITAIRDYIRMIYKKSGKRLRYVLLFGDASYDFRNKSGQVCFIPSYESEISCSNNCLVTDDYFVCMDDNEGIMDNTSIVDVAIGRMPVTNQDDATAMVDKVESYVNNSDDNMGQWRKVITFVTDDDQHYYMNYAEQLEDVIRDNGGEDVSIDKIYLDAYPQVATSSGQRSPECNAAITNRVELGTSIINYIGHAGEVGWAAERILTNEDIFSWRNSSKLHLMVTASCEFSRFDDHTRTSAGEYVFLNHNGGAVAMMTTARVTFGSENHKLMKLLYKHLFDIEGGEYIAMGDVYVHAKQVGDFNSKAYVFFGDPAIKLNYPKNTIEITSVNDHEITQIDTIKALQSVNIKGVVNDIFGNHLPDFDGTLHINVYDKEVQTTTYGNEVSPYTFKLRNNLIYTGKANIAKGEFSADFILPKDINYSYGKGAISLYAVGNGTDAHGIFSDVIVGGLNPDSGSDEEAPEIKIHIDDEKFIDGSITNENPLLIAYIKDNNGVNTSGAAIGHDITATLSGATNKTYILNQFYEAPLSDDEYGTLSYKFYDLNEGEHLLTFRAWDIYNNSNVATIRFNVVKGKVIDIENVANYPNPVDDYTSFTFEHNQKDNNIKVTIRIYDVIGQLVKTIEEHSLGTTTRSNPIKWDATSDNGSKLPSGIYIYNITVSNSQNEESTSYSKLIIK